MFPGALLYIYETKVCLQCTCISSLRLPCSEINHSCPILLHRVHPTKQHSICCRSEKFHLISEKWTKCCRFDRFVRFVKWKSLLLIRQVRSSIGQLHYKNYNYNPAKFLEDLQLLPFHMVNFFDDISHQVDEYNTLFLDVFNEHAPIRRIKIKVKPNPFVSPEIKQLMKTCDNWHKSAMKTNDKLHWNAYKFFKQEVKREIRLAERIYVKSQIINSKGNTNSIWNVINRCLPKKSSSLPQFNDIYENMANDFNKYFSSVGSLTALKADQLAKDQNWTLDSNA